MSRLEEIIASIEQQTNPPVHQWQPGRVGEIDIRIDSQGFWFHEGGPIAREALVKVFASILWCEESEHYLVTPAEKLKITVDDVPFIIQQMEHVEDAWVAVTNLHEPVMIGENHPVELRKYQGQWIPYVQIRYQLWARVNRSIYYQWVSAAMEQSGSTGVSLLRLSSQEYEFDVARED